MTCSRSIVIQSPSATATITCAIASICSCVGGSSPKDSVFAKAQQAQKETEKFTVKAGETTNVTFYNEVIR